MRIRAVRSLIVISLVVVLVVAGTTMAWFTDKYTLPSAAEMVVGTLDFEIAEASVITKGDGEPENGEEDEGGDKGQSFTWWAAGEDKELSWTFINTGTKTAFFRACPKVDFKQDDGDPPVDNDMITWSLPPDDESGWEEGPEDEDWYYYFQPVESGEKIKLVLSGCLSEEAEGGTCSVQLEAESVQASNEAAVKEWSGWPGE